MLRRRHDPRLARHAGGFTLVEVIVTFILLAAVFSVIGSLLVQSNRRMRLSEQRRMAQHTLSNVLERIAAQPWAEIPNVADNGPKLPSEIVERLPGAELRIDVDSRESEEAHRVTVALTWLDHARQPVAPERLVTWIHRDGRSQ